MSQAQRTVLLFLIALILALLIWGPIAPIVTHGFHFSALIAVVILTILSSPGSFYYNLKMLRKAPVSDLDDNQILDADITMGENEIDQLNIHPLAKLSNSIYALTTFGLGIWPFLNMILYQYFHLTLMGALHSLIFLLASGSIILDIRLRKKAKIRLDL